MSDRRPPVSGEPRPEAQTTAGRRMALNLANRDSGGIPTTALLQYWHERIAAIEAEARATPPSLRPDRIASALADCPDTANWTIHERDRLAADLHVALARLSKEPKP